MVTADIYKDIAQRTGGDIYIGVVGPVRTGKSTFIKQFMEKLVLPYVDKGHSTERAVDELPQSADGKTIMTTEPKFIPSKAVGITVGDNVKMNVRMIDCVGYVVDGAMGNMEDGQARMVSTPWFEEKIPFDKAAEIGTQKVICDHSTIGVVVTTDGSIGEIERSAYVPAEERVIKELKQLNKPFTVLLNCREPRAAQSLQLCEKLEEKYDVPVVAVNCMNITENEISEIIECVLSQFPVKQIDIDIPSWIEALEDGQWLKSSVYGDIMKAAESVTRICDVAQAAAEIGENEYVSLGKLTDVSASSGTATIEIKIPQELFYKVLAENTGVAISNEAQLVEFITSVAKIKKDYDRIEQALCDVREKGYGVVEPILEEMNLSEPEIIHQGGKFGVKLKASSPSIHMIRAEIETEISPLVGSEKQSEELAKYLMDGFEDDPTKIWESNIFGKSLHELVNEGLNGKLHKMPEDAQKKFRETLEQVINEGGGGLICIIL
ncbi:MAG: stage IV sporulation protein A [Ruminococcaceae bacterium]|nr:stage IV sporulation protein A [Oscillospiraceae bacterium]